MIWKVWGTSVTDPHGKPSFEYAVKTGLDICYHAGMRITSNIEAFGLHSADTICSRLDAEI